MRHKIQIAVDEELYETIKTRAKKMSLSVSSYARLALISAVPQKRYTLLDEAMDDLRSNNLETLTFAEFKQQIDDLKNDSKEK